MWLAWFSKILGHLRILSWWSPTSQHMRPDTGDSKARSKEGATRICEVQWLCLFPHPPFSFPILRRTQTDFFTWHSTFQKHFWNLCFTILKGAWDWGAYQQQGMTQQWEVVSSQTCLPRGLWEGITSPCVQTRRLGKRGWQPLLTQHLPPLSVSHVCPRSISLSSQTPRVISPCNPFPACSRGSLACLFPVSQLACHLCLSADLSSSRGQQHFGKPSREDGIVAFIYFIHKDDVMKWGCPLHCFVTPKPSLRLVWLCPVGQDQSGSGNRLAVQEQGAQRHPHLCCGLTAWGYKGRYLLCSLYLKAKKATLTYRD